MGGKRGDGSGDSKGGGWTMALPDFWLTPCLESPVFLFYFPFKFIWLAYRADNFRPAIF